jgi:pyruvate dehydrogenase E1 component alpha subunit
VTASPTSSTSHVVAVDAAARAAIAALHAGEGPRLLHCKTYRMTGHTAVDPAGYRDAAEVERWREADPILRLAETLRVAGVSDERIADSKAKAYAEMDEIYARARDTAWPDVSHAYTDVQDLGDPRERPFS